jgi:hypothetical protein
MRPNSRSAIALATIIHFSFQSAFAAAAAYNFINIADNATLGPAGAFSSFGISPAISGRKVAFRGSAGVSGIFTGSGGPIATIAQGGDPTSGGTLKGIYEPAISGNAVAFAGTFQGGEGVFTGNGGPLTTIMKAGDVAPVGTFDVTRRYVAISDGQVAFQGHYLGGWGFFSGDGGPLTTIVKSGDPASFGAFAGFDVFSAAISGNNVAFMGGVGGSVGIFIGNGGPLVPIVITGDPAPNGEFRSFREPAISGDKAAFYATYSHGPGIFAGSGGPLTRIVNRGESTSGGTFADFGHVALSGDMVAFDGSYEGSLGLRGRGLFVGDGGPLTTVIRTGDPLFGSTLRNLEFGRFGLDENGGGNLTFQYRLDNGRYGIAMAVPVPEPATGLMVGILALVAACSDLRIRQSLMPPLVAALSSGA